MKGTIDGSCTRCGKQDEGTVSGKYRMCAECRVLGQERIRTQRRKANAETLERWKKQKCEYNKARYFRLRTNYRCTRCGAQDERTTTLGKSYCEKCWAAIVKRKKEREEEKRQNGGMA